jgi:signal transduction histidine kinase
MLERLAAGAPKGFSRDLVRATAQLKRELERHAAERLQLVDSYSELAAAGQVSMSFAEVADLFIDWIRSPLEELRRKGGRPEKTRQYLEEVSSSVEGLSEVLGVLKACSPQGSGDRRRSIDLRSELEASAASSTHFSRAVRSRMEVRWPREGVLRVEMRPENLHRILHILTMNSMEWMRAVRAPTVRISAQEQGRRCEILFSDNGPGIRREISARVFEPLYSGREGGRGMGLAIARHLVESHGGTIEAVVDGRRRGACIRMLLPRKRARATACR